MEIVKKQFNGNQVSFDLSGNEMINATEMAKACGKQISDFFRLENTNQYLEALSLSMGIPRDHLYYSKEGGNGGGTWVHRKLAIRIAQWCSPEFAVQVDSWIEELFLHGIVSIQKSPQDKTLMIAQALIAAQQIIEEYQAKIAEDAPKVQFTNELIEGSDKFRMDEVCNLLHTTIGRNKFFALLRADKILKADNSPHREYIDQGYFHVILKDTPIGKKTVTLVTGKGLYWLGQKYDHIRLKAI